MEEASRVTVERSKAYILHDEADSSEKKSLNFSPGVFLVTAIE